MVDCRQGDLRRVRSLGTVRGPIARAAFTRQTVRNEFSNEAYEQLRFPMVALVVRADDDLVRLALSGESECHYDVDDCLAEVRALDKGDPRPPRLEL